MCKNCALRISIWQEYEVKSGGKGSEKASALEPQ